MTLPFPLGHADLHDATRRQRFQKRGIEPIASLHVIGGSEPATLLAFMDLVNGWLSARVAGEVRPARQMARTAEVWEKVNRAARDVEIYNLERKPLVFAVFGLLAQAARA